MSERKEEKTTPAGLVDDSPRCRHHWVIEAPNGAISTGKCKTCGTVRDFSNAGETIWEHRGMNASAAPKKSTPALVD
ncbi:MAG: hypothetical protein WEB00_15930 [Dehalococcoidia bacterium]